MYYTKWLEILCLSLGHEDYLYGLYLMFKV